jgi:hypothetical protein
LNPWLRSDVTDTFFAFKAFLKCLVVCFTYKLLFSDSKLYQEQNVILRCKKLPDCVILVLDVLTLNRRVPVEARNRAGSFPEVLETSGWSFFKSKPVF